jgi:hypothetical protein
MFRVLRRLRGALSVAAVVGAIFGAGAAAAQGGVQIDTAVVGGSSTVPISTCSLGQACTHSFNLGFDVTLGNGQVVDTVYIYREGVVGVGSALPTSATVTSLGSLGNAYVAAALSDFSGYNVSVTYALSGGPDHGLPCPRFNPPPGCVNVNDDVLIDYFVSDTAGEKGEFQIKFHTGQYGTGPASFIGSFYGGQSLVSGGIEFGSPGSGVPDGLGGFWNFKDGPIDALRGSNLSGNLPGVPEPAAWALMIGGFFMAGAALRRRAPTPA